MNSTGHPLSHNGKIALDYLTRGYRPIPLYCNKDGSWLPSVEWASFQHRPPTTKEIADWWIKYPKAGIALVCGHEAGLLVLDVDPRHGGIDPRISAPSCTTPRGGVHYHFVAPATIPKLEGPGLEWLGHGHIARVPTTPGYSWYNGGLPLRKAEYKPEELIHIHKPSRRPIMPNLASSLHGDLCEVLSQALGREVRPGTNLKCFCHPDTQPSLAIYPDHAYCFSQNKSFLPRQVLDALGFTHLFHIENTKHLYEINVPEESVRSIVGNRSRQLEEKVRLAEAIRRLGLSDKAKEIDMCGNWVTRKKIQLVKTRTCEDCGTTIVIQNRCRFRFCPECAALHVRDLLRGKEVVFKSVGCSIVRLPLPTISENTRAAFSTAKKKVSETLRRLLGRECGPALHKILTGCRDGEFRWEMVVLATEKDIQRLESSWPYGTVNTMKGLAPAQALALYLEVLAKTPEWKTERDLATLIDMLYGQRVTGSHGEAHGNSKTMKNRPKASKAIQRCPSCGSSNLSRPSYRDASGVHWVNGILLWSLPPPGRPPPGCRHHTSN